MRNLALLLLLFLAGCSTTVVEPYFCRVDDCSGTLVSIIHSASESVYFMAYEFTDKDIADALIERAKYIDVKGIIEKGRVSQQYNKFNYLRGNKVEIVTDRNNATMHHKVWIIDNKVVITGSFNPTKSASERNDENLVIIRDKKVAAQYTAEFWRLFG